MTSVMIRAHAERVYAAASPAGIPITQVCVPNTGTHHRGSVSGPFTESPGKSSGTLARQSVSQANHDLAGRGQPN